MQPIAANYLSDASRDDAEMEVAFENWLVFTKELLGGAPEVEVTLLSDAFALADGASVISVRGQGGAADNLATINQVSSNVRTGMRLSLRNGNTNEPITVKNGTGNIFTADGNDRVLSDTKSFIDLYFDGTNYKEISAARTSIASMIGAQAEAAITLASDAFTPTRASNLLSSETGTSDNCANILQTNPVYLLTLRAASGHTITVKHNAGGAGLILLNDSTDAVLSSTSRALMLLRVSTTWVEIARTGFGSATGSWTTITKTASFTANDAGLTLYKCNTASSAITMTLQATPADGRLYKVWCTSASNNVTINTTGGELIYFEDGTTATTFTFKNGMGVMEIMAIAGGYLIT